MRCCYIALRQLKARSWLPFVPVVVVYRFVGSRFPKHGYLGTCRHRSIDGQSPRLHGQRRHCRPCACSRRNTSRLRLFPVYTLTALPAISNANPNSNNTVLIRQLSSIDVADVADYHAIRLVAPRDLPDAFGSAYEVEVGFSTEISVEHLATATVLGAYAGTGSDAHIIGVVSSR